MMMGKLRTYSFLLLVFASTFSWAQGTNISVQLEGVNLKEIYLGYHLADQKFVEDTLEVDEKGIVKIEDEGPLVPGLYFLYAPDIFYQELVINEPSFSLTADGKGYENFQVEGSRENEFFRSFQLGMIGFQRSRLSLSDSLNKVSGADSLALLDQIRQVNREAEDFRASLVAEQPDLMISKMVRLMSSVETKDFSDVSDERERKVLAYQHYRRTFKDRLDFEEKGLLRTPVFKSNVFKYITEVIPQLSDTIISEIDEIFLTIGEDPIAFRYWLVLFTNHYQNAKIMGQDAVFVHLLKEYYVSGRADWISEESLQKMREEIAFTEPNLIGRVAPDLALLDTTLNPVYPLQSLLEEYIVLFFYDPDCGHCKKKTPVLKEAYYDLKDLGAEVVAVCTISNTDRWKQYINENELEWVNLADPYTQSRFKVDYDVRSVPRLYILNKERKIIAKRLDVDQVVQFITDYDNLVNGQAN